MSFTLEAFEFVRLPSFLQEMAIATGACIVADFVETGPDMFPAERNAMELLFSWLTPKENKQLHEWDYFDVKGEFSGKTYRLHKKYAFGLEELDDFGRVVDCYCVVPCYLTALGDILLAQKIGLETDERRLLSKANKSTLFHRLGPIEPSPIL